MFESGDPREVLNEAWWRPDADLEEIRITYVHRGAPGDRRTADGDEFVDLGRSFIVLCSGSRIPYHRITRIEYGDETVYARPG